MTSYKKIIANMVESEVCHYIEKRTEGKFQNGYHLFASPVADSLKLSTEDKSFGHPTFVIEVFVGYRKYEVHGYVSDTGSVIVSSVNFDRDYVKDEERVDWYADENIRHVHEFLYGDKLSNFAFDR